MHVHLAADHILLVSALLLIGGLFAIRLANRLRVPGMILFLLAGMAIGDDGLGWLHLADARFAQTIAVVALVFILFDGGLANPVVERKRIIAPAATLATVGVAITAALVGIAAKFLFDLSMTEAMMIGAVVASTDAAAVFSVLRGVPISGRLAALIETESGANDPMAALLTVGFVSMAQGTVTPIDWLVFGARQLIGGLLIGWALGRLAGAAMNSRDWVDGPMVPLVGIATAAASFGLSATVGASGFLAVFISGIVVSARAPSYQRPLMAFFGAIAEVAQLGLFFLLGVLVFPSHLGAVAGRSIALAAALILLARPVAVAICLPWFRFSKAEMAFASLAGLRGAVPIVLATFPLMAGDRNGDLIFNVTFFVVLLSAAVQGVAIRPSIRWLGLSVPRPAWDPIADVVPIGRLGMRVVEMRLDPSSPLVGATLADAAPPDRARVITLVRGGVVELPTGSTVMQADDLLSVAIAEQDAAESDLIAWARGGR